MKWRLKFWWAAFKLRFTIDFVLVRDQCRHGFRHTQMELLCWLAQCDLEAQKQFHDELGRQIKQIETFRKI